MDSGYYTLNFKRVLVILSSSEMRRAIIEIVESNELDVNLKYVDSYLEAAKEISGNIADPYDYLILNTDHTNKRLKDFLEFVSDQKHLDENFVISFTRDAQLLFKVWSYAMPNYFPILILV